MKTNITIKSKVINGFTTYKATDLNTKNQICGHTPKDALKRLLQIK